MDICRSLGVDFPSLLLVEPYNGDQAMEALMLAIELKVDLIIVDSAVGMVPKLKPGNR